LPTTAYLRERNPGTFLRKRRTDGSFLVHRSSSETGSSSPSLDGQLPSKERIVLLVLTFFFNQQQLIYQTLLGFAIWPRLMLR
jgi:hypothetical protein